MAGRLGGFVLIKMAAGNDDCKTWVNYSPPANFQLCHPAPERRLLIISSTNRCVPGGRLPVLTIIRRRIMRDSRTILTAVVLVVACCLLPFAGISAEVAKVDPKAEELLQQMCDYLKQQKQFKVESETSYESVLDSGEKLMFLNQVTVYLKRPDRFYSYRRGMVRNQEMFYDGKSFTLYSRGMNLWASTPVSDTIEETLDFIIGELGMTAPGGDFFYADAYDGLMEDVISGAYIGKNEVAGIPCHHLAFRGTEVDWQIWIQEGETPLPRKYVITSKWTTGAPQYTMTIREFDVSSPVPDDRFTFTPPEGASRIDFASNVKITPAGNKGNK
jgi:hypothetical protein